MLKYNLFLWIFWIIGIASAFATPVIIQKPILFNQERVELTREYRREHYGIHDYSIVIIPQMIILHWTAEKTFDSSFQRLYPPEIYDRSDIEKEGLLNVSAHFLVDRDGTIYQLMPDNWMARHVIGLNLVAIGIENVGGVDGKEDLTLAQVKANIELIRYLVKKYRTIHYLIGHYEYKQFIGTPLWKEKNPHYLVDKSDPGLTFMKAVREQVKDLHLRGPKSSP